MLRPAPHPAVETQSPPSNTPGTRAGDPYKASIVLSNIIAKKFNIHVKLIAWHDDRTLRRRLTVRMVYLDCQEPGKLHLCKLLLHRTMKQVRGNKISHSSLSVWKYILWPEIVAAIFYTEWILWEWMNKRRDVGDILWHIGIFWKQWIEFTLT